MRTKFLLLFYFFCFLSIPAQKNTNPYTGDSLWLKSHYENMATVDSVLKYSPETSSQTYPKKFDPNFRNRYKGEDFDYTTVKPKEALSEKIIRWVKKILESVFGEMDPLKANRIASTIVRILAIVIGAVLLYFLIRFIASKEGNFFFGKKNRKLDIKSGDLHENIHEINFPESILQFEKQKDYRSAIRYHFLYLLKKLPKILVLGRKTAGYYSDDEKTKCCFTIK